jgi:glycerol-3-phosphate dehydrogenase (NAD(P)+)
MSNQRITILGNGSWSSALAKLLNDNGHPINWWMRSAEALHHLKTKGHNLHYLSMVEYNVDNIVFYENMAEAVQAADLIVIGIPSAFIADALQVLPKDSFFNKNILSAIKGILPEQALLLNEYLHENFGVLDVQYACISGPCHAEEVAAEKLSYLTFASSNERLAIDAAKQFQGEHLNTVVSTDIYGVQYAAVLKNIYALGAGIAHGLDYGDNFLSVYITNCFAELQTFMDVISTQSLHHYNTSAYLGDLLVTCYSMHSRNRTFGNYIGKGYSVAAAKLELNMVAEGYYASRGIHRICERIDYKLPIADVIYDILWKQQPPHEGFKMIEGFCS